MTAAVSCRPDELADPYSLDDAEDLDIDFETAEEAFLLVLDAATVGRALAVALALDFGHFEPHNVFLASYVGLKTVVFRADDC